MPSLYARVWLSSVWTTPRMVNVRCLLPPPYKRRKRFRLCRSNFVVAAKERLRYLRVRVQACPSINEQVKNQERASTTNLGADLSKHIFSCLGNTSSARELPSGCRPASQGQTRR